MTLLLLLALSLASALAAPGQAAPQPPAAPPPAGQPAKVNADALRSVQFLKRVEDYVALHNKLERTLPPRPEHPTPEQLEAHAHALSTMLIEARPHAKQGDLLTQDTRAYLRRQIARALAGPDGRAIRQEIREDNPGKVKLQVNGRYPEGVPVSTMPPTVLGELPRLPDDVEYRFIGERLILLDVHARLVIDYMDSAIPQ